MAQTNAERQKAYRERKKAQSTTSEVRKRNFATIIYPDSKNTPEDWQERITQWHVPAILSPLHDKDKNPNGEIKKAHYHLLLMFEGLKTKEQVQALFDEIGAVGQEIVNSQRGYARYLCHLDNPEKAQYNTLDVKCFSGADYTTINNIPSDDLKLLTEIFDFIRRNSIKSLAHLIDYAMLKRQDWFMLITQNKAYIIDKYIKSLSWEIETGTERNIIIDEDGEIIDEN